MKIFPTDRGWGLEEEDDTVVKILCITNGKLTAMLWPGEKA